MKRPNMQDAPPVVVQFGHMLAITGRGAGKSFEVLEEVPAEPLAALRAAGASRLGTALHAVLPQVFPQLVAYTLYHREVNIRASAVLGVVGAGGLGRDLTALRCARRPRPP